VIWKVPFCVNVFGTEVPLLQMCLKQRWNELGEPSESDDLRGSFVANVFETKMFCAVIWAAHLRGWMMPVN
jgi:hypothetical protein